MLRIIFAFVLLGLCHADQSESPKPLCEQLSNHIVKCGRSPMKNNVSDVAFECDRLRCLAQESGWLINDKVDNQKVSKYFDTFAKENPDWSGPIGAMKETCLDKDLHHRVEYSNCPNYDILHCALDGVTKLCHADDSHQHETSSAGVLCGEMPNNILDCVGNPALLTRDVAEVKCGAPLPECARMKCLAKESGWLVNDNVDKKKASEYFDNFAKEHPEWTVAIRLIKDTCLTKDLPQQGIHNCPYYDVLHCALTGFIKGAQPSQWKPEERCNYARQFAAHCPVCPNSCFAPAVPIGSCNACATLPRAA